MTKNSAMIGINCYVNISMSKSILVNEMKKTQKLLENKSPNTEDQESIPRDVGVRCCPDVVSSLPSLIGTEAASVTAGYAGAKAGTAIGTMIAPGAGSAIAATGLFLGYLQV